MSFAFALFPEVDGKSNNVSVVEPSLILPYRASACNPNAYDSILKAKHTRRSHRGTVSYPNPGDYISRWLIWIEMIILRGPVSAFALLIDTRSQVSVGIDTRSLIFKFRGTLEFHGCE